MDQSESPPAQNMAKILGAAWRSVAYVAATLACTFLSIQTYQTAIAAPGRDLSNGILQPDGDMIVSSALACLSALFMALLALKLIERRSFAALGFAINPRLWIEVSQGAGLGLAMSALVLVSGWAIGVARFSWSGVPPLELICTLPIYAAILFLSAVFEETLARGYAFQVLVKGIGKSAAVMLSSILFGLGHIFNPHIEIYAILNTALAGILLAVAYLRTRSLWLPSSLHLTWNLSLGFLLGYPVSGVPLQHAVLKALPLGQDWMTGGPYGPEAAPVDRGSMVSPTEYPSQPSFPNREFRGPSGHVLGIAHTRAPRPKGLSRNNRP